MNLQTETKGPVKIVILCTLAGFTLGALGGCLYGNTLERTAMAEEVRQIADGKVNYKSADGRPISKVASYIKAESRKSGLILGIPVGTIAGLAIGIAAIARSQCNPVNSPAPNPDAPPGSQ